MSELTFYENKYKNGTKVVCKETNRIRKFYKNKTYEIYSTSIIRDDISNNPFIY